MHSDPLRRHGRAPKKLLRPSAPGSGSSNTEQVPRPCEFKAHVPGFPAKLPWLEKSYTLTATPRLSSLATRSRQCVQKPSEDELLELYGPPGFKNCKGKWTAASLDSEFKEALCPEDQIGGVPRCPAPLMPTHATLQRPHLDNECLSSCPGAGELHVAKLRCRQLLHSPATALPILRRKR